MEPDDEADSSQVRAVTLRQPRSCVLTAIRTKLISPIPPNFEFIMETAVWQIQDLATNSVSLLADSFIRKHLRGNKRTTVASSGGLVYIVYDSHVTHIVCNPQLRVFHRIHVPPGPDPKYSIAAMVVDAATQQYRIVLAGWNYSRHPASRGGLMDVSLFDSRVMTWRRLCSAPVVACGPLSSVVFEGVLYVLFEIFAAPGRPFELYSCNLDTGAWRFTDARLPHEPRQSIKARPQLVAASGRLFFVGYNSSPAAVAVITVSIWEIALQGQNPTVTEVALLPTVLDGLHVPEFWATVAPVQAVGCGDFIVVSTFLGHRWRWDVVQGTWQAMASFSPVAPLADSHSFFVGPFDMQE